MRSRNFDEITLMAINHHRDEEKMSVNENKLQIFLFFLFNFFIQFLDFYFV